ncbi:radical SAM domain protein [Chitinispirillum alkaliphilum]|nr:radical SAM domain protein [Chitinispirillum alkaliphilum]
MKIALISPKAPFVSSNPEFTRFYESSPILESYRKNWSGLGLGLPVVAALTPDHHECVIIDENIEQINFDEKYDLVGITAMTAQSIRAYEIAAVFRSKGIPVVIGGIHATVLPKEAMEHADAVVEGEAEYLWPQLLLDFQKGQMKRRYKSERLVNLEESPIPRYGLLKDKDYKVIWLQTSRGCPHDCEFCASSRVFGAKYRHKSVGQVVKEVKELLRYNTNVHIGFSDDNLFVNRKYAKELLREFKKLNFRWACQSDISVARDDELLELMRESGCFMVFIGFEGITEKNLGSVSQWKRKQLVNYPQYIEKIQSHGVGIIGSFILGFDGEDESSFEKVRTFIIDNKLYACQFFIMTPFPGTALRSRMEREGRILDKPWSEYTIGNVCIKPTHMTPERLQQGFLEMFKGIYNEEIYKQNVKHFLDIEIALRRRKKKSASVIIKEDCLSENSP